MTDYHRPDSKTMQSLRDMANQLRIDSINATQASNSGHPTSCASAAEIMSVLFFNVMRYSKEFPRDPRSDRFVMSKGHAAPILYAAWAEAGLFPREDLLNLRKLSSDLEGHPTPRLNFIDVATGSLGQGLSVAAGMAYTGKYFDKSDYRVYCLVGDGESAEGSIWEALSFASHYKLDNLVAVFDVNRLGQSDPAMLQHDMGVYEARLKAFGWNTYVVDGHDVETLCKTFHDATTCKDKPTCILAKTFKGKGCPEIEDLMNWHGKPLGAKADKVINEIQKNMKSQSMSLRPQAITASVPDVDITNIKLADPLKYEMGQQVATRLAYGEALASLGKNNPRVVALDGDTKNSTFSDKFRVAHPDRYIECYIAEQNLVGVGIGCATRDRNVVFCSTFAAFFSRAFDQIRMGAISQTNANFAGSHAGISIGEDGPSQMALEDLSMFRSIPGSTQKSDEIKRREESFKKLFEETRTNLTSDMAAKREELTQLKESFKKLFEETRTNLTSDMEAKREELTQLKGKLERPPIAFHAHQVKDLVLDTTDEIIIFTKILINEGAGYDTSTGIFTAPVGGLYQFSVHTCVYKGKHAYIGLVLEGKIIAADINYDNDQYTCSAFGAIARVKSGEKVWVKSTALGSSYQLYQDQYRMITFSGMLVNN